MQVDWPNINASCRRYRLEANCPTPADTSGSRSTTARVTLGIPSDSAVLAFTASSASRHKTEIKLTACGYRDTARGLRGNEAPSFVTVALNGHCLPDYHKGQTTYT